jgi:hypothetical protein
VTHEQLFSRSQLSGVLDNRQRKMEEKALALAPERVLGVSVPELVAELVAEFRVEPLALDLDGITFDHEEVKVALGRGNSGEVLYRPGIAITYYVPFAGDADLFKCRPNTFNYNPPLGLVKGDHVELRVESAQAEHGAVRSQLDELKQRLQGWVAFQRPEVDAFNAALSGWAEGAVALRTSNVRANQDLMASLGVPMRTRADVPTTYPAPTIRRKPSIRQDRALSSRVAPPEPVMLNDDYEHILNIIRNMARVIELSPSAFARMKEEDLRSHFLVHLNGHYEGSATGETFNFEGKTDILVKSEGRNVFVAECKFWNGPKVMAETIDQLLGYTSWRDTKTAILVFNRKRALSTVLDKIALAVAAHDNYVREVEFGDETSFRFVMSHRDDPDRHRTMTVLVFELPT